MGAAIAAAVAAGVTATVGVAQFVQGSVQAKRARQMQLQKESAEQRLNLEKLKRQERAMRTGIAAKRDIEAIDKVVAAVGKAGARSSGGSGGAAMAATRRAMMQGGEQKAAVLSDLRKQAMPLTGLITEQIGAIQQRKDEITLMERAKLEAQAEQNKKAGQQNFLAGVTSAVGTMGGGGDMSALTNALNSGTKNATDDTGSVDASMKKATDTDTYSIEKAQQSAYGSDVSYG